MARANCKQKFTATASIAQRNLKQSKEIREFD